MTASCGIAIMALAVSDLLHPSPATDVEMNLAPSSDALRVDWQCKYASAHSRRAILRIVDGIHTRQLQLGDDQLPVGSLLYKASSDDVLFEITMIIDGNAAAARAVRYVGGPERAVPVTVVPAPSPKVVEAFAHKASAVAVAESAASADRYALRPWRPQHDAVMAQIVPARPLPVISKVSEPPGARPSPTPTAVPTPVLQSNPPPRNHPPAMTQMPVPRAPAVPVQIEPPEPVRRVFPRLNGGPRRFRSSTVSVSVRLDERGRVVGAHVISATPYTSEFVVGAALVAAQQWVFRPCRLRGQAIVSDFVINFNFPEDPH
ncbi:MAG TPA: energy transducer TonB [Bryobacteraceae bacterium]|nr:energy transducer TonB [Bryobacteraceae bacterium]